MDLNYNGVDLDLQTKPFLKLCPFTLKILII